MKKWRRVNLKLMITNMSDLSSDSESSNATSNVLDFEEMGEGELPENVLEPDTTIQPSQFEPKRKSS